MNYLGIDISKSTARCVILNNDGEKSVKPFTLKNNKHEFNELLERFTKHNLSSNNLIIGIEATGIWWENIYCFLTEQKFKVIVLNPHQTNKFREALRKKAKTDDPDMNQIVSLVEADGKLLTQIKVKSIEEKINVRSLLTEEQKILYDAHSERMDRRRALAQHHRPRRPSERNRF